MGGIFIPSVIRGVEYEIHPHTGKLLSRRTYIVDVDGNREYVEDEIIDEMVETGQVTIIGKFEVD